MKIEKRKDPRLEPRSSQSLEVEDELSDNEGKTNIQNKQTNKQKPSPPKLSEYSVWKPNEESV